MDKKQIAKKVFNVFTDDFQNNIEEILYSYYNGNDQNEKEEIVELVLDKVGELYGTKVYKKPINKSN